MSRFRLLNKARSEIPGVSADIIGLGQRGCGSRSSFDSCDRLVSEGLDLAIRDNFTQSMRSR